MSALAEPYIAAGVVVVDSGLVLGITRGHELEKVELPGGGIEPTDRSPQFAAAREAFEETGILLDPRALRYLDANPGPRGAYATYLATSVKAWPKIFRSEPFEGYVGFYQPQVFVNPKARHREFIRRVFDKLGLL